MIPSVVAAPAPGTYRFDPVHTFAQFGVRHSIVGRVDGRFNSIAGECVIVDMERLFERVDVDIDAASVDTKVSARDEDLRSERFFDVANFADIAFRSVDAVRTSDATWTVTGDLTIRKTTKRVALEVTLRGATEDQHGNLRLGLTATAAIARSEFDLTTELLQESGAAGSFDVDISVDVEAVRQGGPSA